MLLQPSKGDTTPVPWQDELADRLGSEIRSLRLLAGGACPARPPGDPPSGLELADQLAKIHAIPPERLPFLQTTK